MKPVFISFLPTSVIILAIVGGGTPAHAQDWTKLGTMPANARCGYFWNFDHGVVGFYTVSGITGAITNPGIYWFDHGKWTQSKYPEPPGAITSIRELSPGHLYATQGETQVWSSIDSGKTWDTTGVRAGVWWKNLVDPDSGGYWYYADYFKWVTRDTKPPKNSGFYVFAPAQDVYLDPTGKLKVIPARVISIHEPVEQISLRVVGGSLAKLDSKHFVISYMDTGTVIKDMGVPYYSHDGGLTWRRSKGMNVPGGFGCFADTCRHIFFTASEDGPVYYSADSGVTWQPCASQLDGGAGDMDVLDGVNGTMYKQTVSAGVFQSVDGGASWQWIPKSPRGTIEDTHLLPVGSFGSELVVFSGQDVWYVTGANFNSRPRSPISVRDSSLHECYPIAEIPVLIRPTGIRHKLRLLTEGDSTHHFLPYDTTILTPAYDSIVIRFHISPPDVRGASSLRVHSHLDDECFPFDWDTVFVDTIPVSAFGISGNFATILACDSVNIPIAIHTAFCDSLILHETQIVGDPDHRLFLLPQTIHRLDPGEADTIWLKYTPHGNVEDRFFSVHISGMLMPSAIVADTTVTIHLKALPDSRCQKDTTQSFVDPSSSDSRDPGSRLRVHINGKMLHYWWTDIEPVRSWERAEIVNALGAVVSERLSSGVATPWDLSTLPPGMYLLRILHGERATANRFILGN